MVGQRFVGGWGGGVRSIVMDQCAKDGVSHEWRVRGMRRSSVSDDFSNDCMDTTKFTL